MTDHHPIPMRAPLTQQTDTCAAPPLPPIDWQAPWLHPYATIGLPLDHAVRQGHTIAHALADSAQHANAAPQATPHTRLPHFVPQAALTAGQSYEGFIHQHWAVPTREHVHDFFNGLIWLHWPRSKAQLNALQSAEIARLGIQGQRGPVRDACTVFDENGALLLAPAPLHEALIARDWMRLFWTLRPLWAQAQFIVFGHALLEQLCTPRKPLCAHVLTVPLPAPLGSTPDGDINTPPTPHALDGLLAEALTAAAMRAKPLTPLPVLGIPGWCDENVEPHFYEDTCVFRPRRPE